MSSLKDRISEADVDRPGLQHVVLQRSAIKTIDAPALLLSAYTQPACRGWIKDPLDELVQRTTGSHFSLHPVFREKKSERKFCSPRVVNLMTRVSTALLAQPSWYKRVSSAMPREPPR